SLVILRFIMGLGLGAEVIVGYGMLGEFIPPSRRGKWSAILNVTANSSLLVSTVASYFIIPHFGWRWMFVIVGVGALLTWVARKKIPESPRWLESVGRVDEASAIVDGIEREIAKTHTLPEPQLTASRPQQTFQLKDLFGAKLVRATLLGMVINVVTFSGLYGFIIWVPTFLMKSGMTMSSSLGYSSLMASGSIVGAGAAAFLSDRIGRKWGITIISFVAAVIGVAYPHMGSVLATTLMGWLLVAAMYFGGALAFATYVPELFPTELRMRGTAVSNVAGRLASIAAPQVVVMVFHAGWGITGVTCILAGLMIFQGLVVGIFGIETRKRSLDSQFDEIRIGDSEAPAAVAAGSAYK
ncbi:MFS transporter, partial [Paraburkholderia xenovorans]|uniref:MFS transporter n=1 Tax=Paraburkholderia xenovorans TaxID=36873 RepID=UPI0038BA6A69